MSRKHYQFILLLSFFTGVTLTACKPRQKIVVSRTPVEHKANSTLFSDILAAEFPYRTFSAKLDMNLMSATRSLSSRARLHMVKDSILQISFQPLFGFEMFRFCITPDTVLLLDRMNKRYVLESIAVIKEHYPIGFDFYALQAIFSDAPFLSGKEKPAGDDFAAFSYHRTSDRNVTLSAEDADSGIRYSFLVNGDDRITFTHLFHPERKYSLQWEYNHFMMVNDCLFPHKMEMTVSSESKKIDGEILFSSITTDQLLTLKVTVPEHYSRTTLSSLLKSVSQQL